jgi:hypothetical protein
VHLTGFAPALAALIFDSPCRSATVNTPANRRMPHIGSVVIGIFKKKVTDKQQIKNLKICSEYNTLNLIQ